MRLLLKIIKAACGLFVAYIAIGCAVGFALPSPHGEGCFPFGATFGVLLTKCSNAAADMFLVGSGGVAAAGHRLPGRRIRVAEGRAASVAFVTGGRRVPTRPSRFPGCRNLLSGCSTRFRWRS